MRRSSLNKPRIVLVGCGAIAELFYVPALLRLRDRLGVIALVDNDIARAKLLSLRLDGSKVVSNLEEEVGRADGVILAVPHHLHFQMAKQSLESGAHVLCEKPLAETVAEAKELVEISKRTNRKLLVNQTRRMQESNRMINQIIASGRLGGLQRIEYYDGNKFMWPSSSGFYFDRRSTKKGVLSDIGSHVADLLCWWLGAQPSVVTSFSDSFGGIEAVVDLALRKDSCDCRVRLSRLGRLPNIVRIAGEEATIECGVYDGDRIVLRGKKGTQTQESIIRPKNPPMEELAENLLLNFLEVIISNAEPLVPADSVISSIALIEDAYRKAQPFRLSWYDGIGGHYEA